MNIREFHIDEVHAVKSLPQGKWETEPWVEVDVTTARYGQKERRKHSFPKAYWEKSKARGYWIG